MAQIPNRNDQLRSQINAARSIFSVNNVLRKNNGNAVLAQAATTPPIQPNYTTTVRLTYANAVLAEDFGDRCATFITSLCAYAPANVVSAACICSDDKNAPIFPGNAFGQYPESLQQFSGPFFAGGIGGYPFTGIVGTFAWSSHITDTGALFYYIQPHIGITAAGQVGFMIRQGQATNSATCGALNVAQQYVATGGAEPTFPGAFPFGEFDYQQYVLTENLYSANSGTVRTSLINNYNTYQDSAANPNALGYGARMKIATDATRDAAATAFKSNILPAAYNALFGADKSRDVFVSVGTFINVDDGYKAYIDSTSFERYNPDTEDYTNYTAAFNSGL
jgi:hypothetical protein